MSIGLPPFSPGDLVRSITDDHSTARKGRTFYVREVVRPKNGKKWRFLVDHPRFGKTSYYCDKFELVKSAPNFNSTYSNALESQEPMYVAIDITNTRPEDLRPSDFKDIIVMDQSEMVMRDWINRHLQTWPHRKIAIFSLAFIAETTNNPQIIYKDMRK